MPSAVCRLPAAAATQRHQKCLTLLAWSGPEAVICPSVSQHMLRCAVPHCAIRLLPAACGCPDTCDGIGVHALTAADWPCPAPRSGGFVCCCWPGAHWQDQHKDIRSVQPASTGRGRRPQARTLLLTGCAQARPWPQCAAWRAPSPTRRTWTPTGTLSALRFAGAGRQQPLLA